MTDRTVCLWAVLHQCLRRFYILLFIYFFLYFSPAWCHSSRSSSFLVSGIHGRSRSLSLHSPHAPAVIVRELERGTGARIWRRRTPARGQFKSQSQSHFGDLLCVHRRSRKRCYYRHTRHIADIDDRTNPMPRRDIVFCATLKVKNYTYNLYYFVIVKLRFLILCFLYVLGNVFN